VWEDAEDSWDDVPDDDGTDEPTPAERLQYALGQLWSLVRLGKLHVAPADFDVRLVARVIGVARDIELVTDGPLGRSFHFLDEALVLDRGELFPWHILDTEEWRF
jgi:hypothetical protein